MKIIETEMVGDPYEDWSNVRSHGRAARRRAKHPQRIVTSYRVNGKFVHDKLNNIIYMHPCDANKLRQTFPPAKADHGMNPW